MHDTLFNRYLYGRREAPSDFYARIADVLHVPESFIVPKPDAEPTAA